jgi:hypothetical protein
VINEPYAKAYVAAPATAESIERINRALNISLPGTLVRFAEDCPSYGTWFASIGADYDSYLHIWNSALEPNQWAALYPHVAYISRIPRMACWKLEAARHK